MILESVFWVFIFVTDVENDGTHNYLLQTPRGSDRQISISYSNKEPLKQEVGQLFPIRAKIECFETFALDKAPKVLEETYPWGIPRKQWLCDTDKIEVLNGR